MNAERFYKKVQQIISEYKETGFFSRIEEKSFSDRNLIDLSGLNQIEILTSDYKIDNFTVLNYLTLRENYIKEDGYINFLTGESFALQYSDREKEKVVYFSYDDIALKKQFCENTSDCLEVLYCLFELYILRKKGVIDFEDKRTHEKYLQKCLEFTKGHGKEFLHYEVLIMTGF